MGSISGLLLYKWQIPRDIEAGLFILTFYIR
jgi:hypothetical protein